MYASNPLSDKSKLSDGPTERGGLTGGPFDNGTVGRFLGAVEGHGKQHAPDPADDVARGKETGYRFPINQHLLLI